MLHTYIYRLPTILFNSHLLRSTLVRLSEFVIGGYFHRRLMPSQDDLLGRVCWCWLDGVISMLRAYAVHDYIYRPISDIY